MVSCDNRVESYQEKLFIWSKMKIYELTDEWLRSV